MFLKKYVCLLFVTFLKSTNRNGLFRLKKKAKKK